tara:strand:- start:257 stop:487 length:231 start_codon:yes stop_codon:yes gene_type:complete
MAKCFGRIPITSAAVDCIGFVNIVAVVVVELMLVLEVEGNAVVQPLGEVEQAIVHQAVDCHKTDKTESHLDAVDRN